MNEQNLQHRIEFPVIQVGLNKVQLCKHGVIVYLISDNVIGKALNLYGEFAEESNTLLSQLVRPGDTVLDIGANVGTVTTCMARRVGSQGKVYAFEPQRLIFQNLCASIALNGFTNVYCLQSAVGATNDSISIPQINYTQQGNFGAVSLDRPDFQSDRVDLITVDSLELDSLRAIKIDVEGMEFEVLKGAKTAIEKYLPIVYMESKKSQSTSNCIEMLQDLGYSLYWHFAFFYRKDNYRKNPVNIFGPQGDINMLCIPRGIDINVNLPKVSGVDADWQQEYQAWTSKNKQ